MSSSDETVKVRNTSSPVTAASEGGPAPSATDYNGDNIPAVSQDLDEDPFVRPESEGGYYDVSADRGDDLIVHSIFDHTIRSLDCVGNIPLIKNTGIY